MKKALPAVFAALDDEIRILRSRMIVDESIHSRPSLIIRGQLDNRPLLLVRSGVGKKAMRHAVECCFKHFEPQLCLNVGYAGGTTPELGAGDLVLGSPVTDAASRQKYFVEESLLTNVESLCRHKDFKMMRGGIVTVEKVAETPHEKAFIGTEYSAQAVDMESAAFMEQCQHYGKAALVMRVILDSLEVKLPDMSDTVDENGELSWGQVAGHVVHHPRDILSFPKIEYYAMKAREIINVFVKEWLAAL